MHTKEYEILANAIAKVPRQNHGIGERTLLSKWDLIQSIVAALSKDNERFNADLFVKFCYNGEGN